MIRTPTLACLVALMSSCAAEPASCPDEPVRVLTLAEPAEYVHAARAADHTYYTLHVPAEPSLVIAVGTTCQDDAVEVVRGTRMDPARLHLDPSDDDPTIACDLFNRFFRLDLTGERGPTLLLPHLSCKPAIPTAYGVLLTDHSAMEPTLWLFPDFPDEATARRIGTAYFPTVAGDAVFYAKMPAQIRRHDLATGHDAAVVDDAYLGFDVTDTHLLWVDASAGGPHTVHLLDLDSGEQLELGENDPEADDEWSLDASGQYVIHTSLWEAFDLDGRAVSLPVPGKLSRVLPGPAYLSYDEIDGSTYYTRIGADEPTRLDFSYPLEDPLISIGVHPLFPDRLQYRGDRVLHLIPIDGGPTTQIADVGPYPQWLDTKHLLMNIGDDLVTLHVPSGERTVVVEDITNYSYTDDILADGIHVLYVRDGASEVWHYPASVLLAGP